MKVNISLLVSAFAVLLYAGGVSAEDPLEKCPYRDTVDLTEHVPLANGSYLYQDILIPAHKLAQYDYRLRFRDRQEPADPHLRGCVCRNPKHCVKLCCERGEYFNEESFECEKIPDDLTMPSHMSVISENGEEETVNIFEHFVHQVGRACKYPETLTVDSDEWELKKTGILFVYGNDEELDTVSYCLTPYHYNGSNEMVLVPMSCPVRNEMSFPLLLNTYSMAISVVFLIPTILVYLSLKELRGNMRGKLLICYLISLTVGYSILSYINITEEPLETGPCSALGFICYYSFMAAFLWLSVLCFDIWINFKEHSVQCTKKKTLIRFIFYSLYAWGLACLLTLITMWSQWSELVPEAYKPGIGDEVCWLDTDKWAASIYYYWPSLIIIAFNIATFAHLSLRIYRVRRNLAKMTQKQTFFKENGVVILRLFIIMGISWSMDILSYSLRHYHIADYLFMITDFCNAAQGVLIFVLFVLKRNIYEAMRKSWNPSVIRKPRRSLTSITTNFSKLSTSSTGHA